MDFSKSYSSEWKLYRVNMDTWADGNPVRGFLSASIEKTKDGMVESGSFEIDADTYDKFEEGYYRLVMYGTQDGRTERFEICTLYCFLVSGTLDKRRDTRSITGKSVLAPIEQLSMPTGSFVAGGSDCAAYIGNALRKSLAAPVVVNGSFTLNEDYVFDVGANVLETVWNLLDAGRWCLQISGDGTVTIAPLSQEPQYTFPIGMESMVFPGIGYETDMSSVPNRFMAMSQDGKFFQAVNDDPSSPVSTVSWGFIVDAGGVETSPTLTNGETLQEYCDRNLMELSVQQQSISYSREYIHGLLPNTLVRGTLGIERINGDFRIENQSLECGSGIKVSERAIREVKLWE